MDTESELRALRRLTDAQQLEIAELRRKVAKFKLLHDDEGEAQVLELEAVKAELLQLRDIIWPEVLELRSHAAEQEADGQRLREELEVVQPLRAQLELELDAVESLRLQLAEAVDENSNLKARCNVLVVDLEKAVDQAERADSRLRELEGDGEGDGGVVEQLRVAKIAEARHREHAEALAVELANARLALAARAERASAAQARALSPRRQLREAEERLRGGQALSSAAEAARRWVAHSGTASPATTRVAPVLAPRRGQSGELASTSDGESSPVHERTPARVKRPARASAPLLGGEADDDAQQRDPSKAGRRREGDAEAAALSLKLKELHASFRQTVPVARLQGRAA